MTKYNYRVICNVNSLSGQCGMLWGSGLEMQRDDTSTKTRRYVGCQLDSTSKIQQEALIKEWKSLLQSCSKLLYSTNHHQKSVAAALEATGWTRVGEEVVNVNSSNQIQLWEINRHDLGMSYPDPNDTDEWDDL